MKKRLLLSLKKGFGYLAMTFVFFNPTILNGQSKIVHSYYHNDYFLIESDLDGQPLDTILEDKGSPYRMEIDNVNSKIYWANGETFYRCNFDGSNRETIFRGSNFLVRDLAVDPQSNKFYWINSFALVRTNLDGTGKEILLTGMEGARSMNIDTVNDKIYWSFYDKNTSEGSIQTANLDGSEQKTFVTTGEFSAVSLALDIKSKKLYWAIDGSFKDNNKDRAIHRINIDGSGEETVIDTGFNSSLKEIAIDYINEKIYWSEFGDNIRRSNFDGSDIEDVIDGSTYFVLLLPPVEPQLISPVKEDNIYLSFDTLFWNRIENAGYYQLQVSNKVDFSDLLIDSSLLVKNIFIPDNLPSDEYYWRVKSVNNFGQSAWSEPDSFKVIATPPAPVADFSANATSGSTDFSVSFTDNSTGDVSGWAWNFGDQGTSTVQNPSHTYTDPGTYTVSLTVTGAGGNDTETKTDYITVTSIDITDVSDFDADNNFIIYPNPAGTTCSIQIPDYISGAVDIKIYNINGEELISDNNIKDKLYYLNLSQLKKGVYYISIISDNTTLTEKLIISR